MSVTHAAQRLGFYAPHQDWPHKLRHCAQKIEQYLATQGLEIAKPIGSGSQGIVFSLADIKTGKISHALKITAPGRLGITPFKPHRGSHLVANLKHPSLCIPTQFFYLTPSKTLSFTPSKGSTCIGTVMPYIQGRSFYAEKNTIASKAERIFHFGVQITEALDELATNGLEHRDLRDFNIMVDKKGVPYIIDFDLCAKKLPVDQRTRDHEQLRRHLKELLRSSSDIKPRAKKFLLRCVDGATPEQLLSPTFMQNCLDHLEEIQRKPTSRL